MKITFDDQTLELIPLGSSRTYRATLGEQTVEVEVLRADPGRLELRLNGRHVTAYISSDGAQRWVTVDGRTRLFTKASASRRSGAGHAHTAGALTAPMPGQVRAVNVTEGEAVNKGQTLLVLEAMKMEIRIQANRDGQITRLLVKPGQTVEREQVLIELEGS